MKAGLVRMTACSLSVMLIPAAGYSPAASAQSMWAQVATDHGRVVGVQIAQLDSQAPIYLPQQLDQLLAPIALYPDALLAQILMAATYPIEVVEAARWVQDPYNAQLRGDQLDAALQQQDWDPSVKSLVPFPQILQMMNSKLDWTQALGNAFLAQQTDVMVSVQRLRAEAWAAGTLQSTPQQMVSTQGQIIVIEPANPQLVYVPYYDPRIVYGRWGYAAYPPVYFPPPPNYAYVAGPGIFFGIGFGIISALWGWDRWDWNHHDIYIDRDRYNRINNYSIVHDNTPRYTANTWQHDPVHRRGVPYSDPAVRQKFQPASAGSADTRRDYRGFDNRGGVPGAASPGAPRGAAPTVAPRPADTGRPGSGQSAAGRQGSLPNAQGAGEAGRLPQARPPARATVPQTNARPVTAPPPQRAPIATGRAPPRPTVEPPVAPAFSSFGKGPDVRAQSQRGQTSRQSMAPAAPRVIAPPRAATPQQRSATPPAAAPQQRSATPPQQRSAPQKRNATPPQPQGNAPKGGGQKGGGNDERPH
jgi:Protein of unknown function (DUF3300)